MLSSQSEKTQGNKATGGSQSIDLSLQHLKYFHRKIKPTHPLFLPAWIWAYTHTAMSGNVWPPTVQPTPNFKTVIKLSFTGCVGNLMSYYGFWTWLGRPHEIVRKKKKSFPPLLLRLFCWASLNFPWFVGFYICFSNVFWAINTRIPKVKGIKEDLLTLQWWVCFVCM